LLIHCSRLSNVSAFGGRCPLYITLNPRRGLFGRPWLNVAWGLFSRASTRDCWRTLASKRQCSL
jgi:hypothetical protein